ncbi:MAG: hypothetical protein CMB57_04025 [Euryarchaeota archaeon]|nr:hypothetical protein [Euryarchaeota archaeon]
MSEDSPSPEVKRKPGRPKGSKNKPKSPSTTEATTMAEKILLTLSDALHDDAVAFLEGAPPDGVSEEDWVTFARCFVKHYLERKEVVVERVLSEYTHKPYITADEVELPNLLPEFSDRDLMTFYKNLDKDYMTFDVQKEVIVRYMNRYFCSVEEQTTTYVEFKYIKNPEVVRSPNASQVVGQEAHHRCEFLPRTYAQMKGRLRKCLMFLPDDDRRIEMFEMYAKHLDATQYTHGMGFIPHKRVRDEQFLNIFPGLQVVNELRDDPNFKSTRDFDMNKVQPFLDHLRHLAGGDDTCYNYLIDWLAFPIQTGEKTNVALICKGQPGCGKGFFFETVMNEHIYGKRLCVQLNGGKQLNEKNNSVWKYKMLVVIDEPHKDRFTADQRNNLKNLITDRTTMVREKYVADKMVEDFTNFAFTCNSIPTEFLDHDDRRFFVVQHDGEHVKDEAYFAKLRSLVFEHKAYKDLYLYLLAHKIKKFKKGQAPPQTRIKERLMIQSIDPIFRYLRHLVELDEDFPDRVPFKTFHENAVKWCKQERMEGSIKRWKTSTIHLKEILREQFEDWELDRPVTKGFEKATRCVIFPTREELKEQLIEKKLYLLEGEFDEEVADEPMEVDEEDDEYPEEGDENPDFDEHILNAQREEWTNELQRLELNSSEAPDFKFDHE